MGVAASCAAGKGASGALSTTCFTACSSGILGRPSSGKLSMNRDVEGFRPDEDVTGASSKVDREDSFLEGDIDSDDVGDVELREGDDARRTDPDGHAGELGEFGNDGTSESRDDSVEERSMGGDVGMSRGALPRTVASLAGALCNGGCCAGTSGCRTESSACGVAGSTNSAGGGGDGWGSAAAFADGSLSGEDESLAILAPRERDSEPNHERLGGSVTRFKDAAASLRGSAARLRDAVALLDAALLDSSAPFFDPCAAVFEDSAVPLVTPAALVESSVLVGKGMGTEGGVDDDVEGSGAEVALMVGPVDNDVSGDAVLDAVDVLGGEIKAGGAVLIGISGCMGFGESVMMRLSSTLSGLPETDLSRCWSSAEELCRKRVDCERRSGTERALDIESRRSRVRE